MDGGQSALPDSINPNNFPAKLWRLMNNPAYKAINWDASGTIVVINQHLFETQILSPKATTSDSADAFKTTNFSSFVRQLNLYGFRKAEQTIKDSGDCAVHHYFFNPNFKRDHPELVACLRRLTVDNKAKMQAGLEVKGRASSKYVRHIVGTGGDGGDTNVKRGSSLLSSTHKESTHPYFKNKAQATTQHTGTPIPPRFLIRGHGAAHSPTVFAADRGIPVALSHHYAGEASNSNAVHIQQALLARTNHGNPNFSFNAPSAQYQPGFYSPVCQCYHSNLVASQMAGSGLQTGPFSPLSYYQASYPVNMLCHVDNNQDIKKEEHQELKKCEINLDTIFQIADEVMQTQPSNNVVRVLTPEKPGPVLVPLSNPVLCDRSASTMKALHPGPILMAVSSHPDLYTYRQQDDSVVSVPEQMPEDAISEVTVDDASDTEVKSVEVSDTEGNTSQNDNSICTGSTSSL